MTITKLNLFEVPKVIELCRKLGVNWFMHYNFIPTGRGKDIIHLDLSLGERERLLKTLYENNNGSDLNLLSTAPQFARIALQYGAEFIPTHFYNVNAGERLKQLAEFIGGCGAGRFIYIDEGEWGHPTMCLFPAKSRECERG